jgi:carboxymethylenebutenolidase
MIEEQVQIATADGRMPTSIVHPKGGGPFPVVLVLMDGVGIRPELQDVARRLAKLGYYAMLPDLYYRAELKEPLRPDSPAGWDHMTALIQSLTDERVIGDAEALLAHASTDAAAGSGPAGLMGFCMGGRLSVILCQGLGERIRAAAGIHPGNLVNDADESPHRHLDRVAAELYLAIADNDQWCSPEQVAMMEKALVEQGLTHQIEWHPGALHGFGVGGGKTYHEQASELVWDRVETLFARKLR